MLWNCDFSTSESVCFSENLLKSAITWLHHTFHPTECSMSFHRPGKTVTKLQHAMTCNAYQKNPFLRAWHVPFRFEFPCLFFLTWRVLISSQTLWRDSQYDSWCVSMWKHCIKTAIFNIWPGVYLGSHRTIQPLSHEAGGDTPPASHLRADRRSPWKPFKNG